MLYNQGLTGTGNLSVSGTGTTIAASGVSNFAAATVSSGSLYLYGAMATTSPSLTLNSGNIIGSGATITGTVTAIGSGTITADTRGPALVLASSSTLSGGVVTLNGAGILNLDGLISGSGTALILSGTGTDNFGSAWSNTYSGATTVSLGNLGTVNITGPAATGTGDLDISSGSVTVASGGSITGGTTNSLAAGAALTVQSGGTAAGTNLIAGGTLTLNSGGTMSYSAATLQPGAVANVNGDLSVSGSLLQTGAVTTLNGTLSQTTVEVSGGQLTASGAAAILTPTTLQVDTAGLVYIDSGATVGGAWNVGGSSSLTIRSGASTSGYTGATVQPSGLLILNQSLTASEPMDIQGTLTIGSTSPTVGAAGATLTVEDGGTATVQIGTLAFGTVAVNAGSSLTFDAGSFGGSSPRQSPLWESAAA